MAPGQDAAESEESTLNVNVLKEIARKDLVDALNSVSVNSNLKFAILTLCRDQVNGAKTLVLDASLAGPLGLVTEVSLLKVRLWLLRPL
jgi:hypothetical protein